MNELNLNKYFNIVNDEKMKLGLENYVPLYPMLRIIDNKLYVAVMLYEEKDKVWEINGNCKAKYWVLIDPNTDKIFEFNDTKKKDFVIGKLIQKNYQDKQIELSKYTVQKALQYKNYLIEDIKNEKLPIQKKLYELLGNELDVNGDILNVNDYLLSKLEDDMTTKINELVNLLLMSKYGSVTFYYDKLFNQVINKYISDNIIDYEKIKLCSKIMNYYYDGVIAIDNFFNFY